MAFLKGKTPISFLQELCTKRGITPQYDLIANEGAVHEPTYVFRATAGELKGTGKGPSKKKAKHNAAYSLLTQMLGISNASPPPEFGPNEGNAPQRSSSTDDEEGPGNPVGELQELTQKRMLAPPMYEFTNEQGPPHAREFVCTVKLCGLEEQGVGKSKKLAKRNAAATMLKLIKEGIATPQPEPEQVEEEEESIPLPQSDLKATYQSLKEGKQRVATLTPQTSRQLGQFYQRLRGGAGGPALGALQQPNTLLANTNYCQMLQEIAEEQRFEVSYIDVQEPANSGLLQCLVQLATLPVAVCHGSGTTRDDARAQSAHNALQYLRIMTKKP